MLHEVAYVHLVVHRRAAAGEIDDFGHVLDRGRPFHVSDVARLLHSRPRANAAFHRDGLHGLDLVAAHRGDRIVDEAFSRGGG